MKEDMKKKPKKVYKALTLGSATIDFYIFTNPEIVWKKKEELIAYPLGSKIHITKTYTTIGGGGTNAALVLKKLNFSTSYLGVVGKDEKGKLIKEFLKKNKIHFIGETKGINAFSVILDAIGHDRTIFVYKGDTNNLERYRAKKYDFIFISNTLGKTLKTTKKIVKEMEGFKAFNPSEYMIKEKKEDTLFIAKRCDVVVMNKEEAEIFLNKKNEDAKDLTIKVFEKLKGNSIVSITDGPRGVYTTYGEDVLYLNAKKLKVIDSTGAGDSFSSTFSAFLFKGYTLEESMKAGIINSESVIMKIGAKAGIMDERKILKEMKRDKRKIKHIRY